MEKILPIILTTDVIQVAEGVSERTAQNRLTELRGVCGKAKPTIFSYFEHNGFTTQDVAFSFGSLYANRFEEAKRIQESKELGL
jgi:hypothetical protein